MLKPGGVLVFDTINRTYKSYLGAIVLAQVSLYIYLFTHTYIYIRIYIYIYIYI